MGARSKRAQKTTQASDYDLRRLSGQLTTPRTGRVPLASWTLQDIFAARDAQLRGHFQLPARLSESMQTDDAISVAREARLAPQRCIGVKIEPAKGFRGASIGAEADALFGPNGVGITDETLGSIHACLVDHDIAIGANIATPRADGSRVDFEMHAWPLEYVRWDPYYRVLKTTVDPTTIQPGDEPDPSDPRYGITGAFEVPIIHGDGRWVVFQRYEIEPFKRAPLLAAALVWARHAYALRDWAKASVAHGSAKVIGALPEGVPLQGSDGKLSAEAEAILALLRSVASDDSPAGIKPAGSTLDFLTNNSTAWQVWSELVANAERSAARLYLGTDGILGSKGGAPGVDIQSLFGVATTKVQGDLECISKAINTGVIEPWCATNFGDSSLAPKRSYCIPDGDADALQKSLADRTTAFSAALKGLRDAGISITQDHVNGLAADFKVRAPQLVLTPAPQLPETPPTTIASPALPGPPGPAGRDGVNGRDGAAGPQGERGKDGPTGLKGEPGRDGIQGMQGMQGLPGSAGRDGRDGVVDHVLLDRAIARQLDPFKSRIEESEVRINRQELSLGLVQEKLRER